jgi:2-polyprenyl-3-methyl-5-hydroxy-6-metoxy-1,4-benzoquinol methylase
MTANDAGCDNDRSITAASEDRVRSDGTRRTDTYCHYRSDWFPSPPHQGKPRHGVLLVRVMPERRRYEFGEDVRRERDRLGAVERALDAQSQAALAEVGVTRGWRCWEVGAGGGSIARWLARMVGADGHVLGTDLDDAWFDAGDEAITFRRHDVVSDPAPEGDFDLVHARFLLEHLDDPRGATVKLMHALRPGGVLVLEDSAGLGIDTTPATPIFDDFVPAWERAGRAVGWNPTYGCGLMADLRSAGLTGLRGRQYRQLAPGGDGWAHVILGIARLRAELSDQGFTDPRLAEIRRCLADPGNLIAGPPITIAWGWREGPDAMAHREASR